MTQVKLSLRISVSESLRLRRVRDELAASSRHADLGGPSLTGVIRTAIRYGLVSLEAQRGLQGRADLESQPLRSTDHKTMVLHVIIPDAQLLQVRCLLRTWKMSPERMPNLLRLALQRGFDTLSKPAFTD